MGFLAAIESASTGILLVLVLGVKSFLPSNARYNTILSLAGKTISIHRIVTERTLLQTLGWDHLFTASSLLALSAHVLITPVAEIIYCSLCSTTLASLLFLQVLEIVLGAY